MEIWKPIPFAPLYKASSEGNIMNLRGKLMRTTENYAGYLVCDLHKKQFRVNRIICITFHGDPPTKYHHAAHKDSNRRNNRENNLYWATPQENGRDLKLSGHAYSGLTALTIDQVRYIKEQHAQGKRIVRLAEEFPNVCYATISHIVNGRTWKNV